MARLKTQVTYPRNQVLAVLRTLNELVVSLDQIGSASYDMTKAEHQAALSEFMGPKMFRKWARARAILSAPFSTALGADEMDELEREMQALSIGMTERGRQAGDAQTKLLQATARSRWGCILFVSGAPCLSRFVGPPRHSL